MASAVVVALVVGLGVGWRLTGGHARATAPAGGPSCPKGPVTLTFDDGPDPVNTPQVLDLLKRYGVTATFFVIGSKAATYPDLIRREAQEGHRIENHSWDHPHLPTLSADDIRTQLFGTSTAIESAGAPPPVLFRPPFGETSPVVNRIANELGMQVIRWTTDSNDWRGNSPAQITEAVLGHLRAHAVVLAHDGVREAPNTIAALPQIITGLRAAGYCTQTAPEPPFPVQEEQSE